MVNYNTIQHPLYSCEIISAVLIYSSLLLLALCVVEENLVMAVVYRILQLN